MKHILIVMLLSGCSTTTTVPQNNERWHAYNDRQNGYYWRDHFRHDYSNAPPVRDIK